MKKFIKYIYDDIEAVIKEREKILLKYLDQEGLCNYEKINIMDVGWGGSLQEALKILLNNKVMGYYFGTIPTEKEDIMSNSIGFAFDEAKPDDRYMAIFNMPMMYEFVFSAPHGTTLGFKQEGDKIVPILDDNDDDYVNIVDKLQNSALEIINKYLQYSDYLTNLSIEDSIYAYREMTNRRDFRDLIEFRKLTNSVLYFNNKDNYVDEFDEDYIYQNHDEFLERIYRAMWRDSYLVKGIKDEEQWRAHKLRYDEFIRKKDYIPLYRRQYIKKAIRNPKKAVRRIKDLMVR